MIICFAIFCVALCAVCSAYILEICWNNAVAPAFSFHLIGFWQSVGLIVAIRILFGGIKEVFKGV